MKKTIKIIQKKLESLRENNNGTLQGGFASIKGGFDASLYGVNTMLGCTNSKDCTQSTNSGGVCSNTGTCFM